MDDRQIQELVRMALDVEALESAQDPVGPYAFVAPRSGRRAVVAWAGAAAACLAVVAGTWVALRPVHGPTLAAREHAPGRSPAFPVATEPKVTTASVEGEHCVLLTIFRDSFGEVSCVNWRPYDWGEGRSLAQVTPAELLDAAAGAWCGGSASEMMVVAVAGPRDSVPASDAVAQDIAYCIASSGELCEQEPGSYQSVALSCLPAGVHAMAETVLVARY